MGVNRICNVEDFAALGINERHRKAWEITLAMNTLRAAVTRKTARVLGVGAGQEATIFQATTLAAEVHATDLYADAGMWHEAAPNAMLLNPVSCAPQDLNWNPERLIVQHMDARSLRYPNEYFDAVFSSSSIEHFGSLDDIARAAREIGRVLRPGGVATISTEYKLAGPDGHGWPGVVVFDETTLRQNVIEPSGCTLIEPIDTTISEATLATTIDLEQAVALINQGKSLPLPHVVVTYQGYTFSSVHFVLRKGKG